MSWKQPEYENDEERDGAKIVLMENKKTKTKAELVLWERFMDQKESKALFDKLMETTWDIMYAVSYGAMQMPNRKMKWYSEDPLNIYAFSKASLGESR